MFDVVTCPMTPAIRCQQPANHSKIVPDAIDLNAFIENSFDSERSDYQHHESERSDAMDLFFSTSAGDLVAITALLESGIDPNFRDYEQRCPLHIAAGFGSLDVIQILLDHGADVNALDMRGRTPFLIAEMAGHFEAERLLKTNGAKAMRISTQSRAVCEKWEIDRAEVTIGEVIASTLKSSVHRATWRGLDVVAKTCRVEATGAEKEQVEQEMLHELSILGPLRHPDLVMFLGCSLHESPIMFMTQYMPGGDLENYYSSKRKESKKDAPWAPPGKIVLRWSRSILRALDFLHNLRFPIVHRDLKPLNILLTESYEAKVSDFGISRVVSNLSSPPPTPSTVASTPPKEHSPPPNEPRYGAHLRELKEDTSALNESSLRAAMDRQASPFSLSMEEQSDPMCRKQLVYAHNEHSMTGGVGSLRYMAPEVARHEVYTEKIDIYAFGLILFFMSSGRRPFHEFHDLMKLATQFVWGQEPRPRASECPLMFRSTMEAAWDPVPANRPSAGDLLERLRDSRPGTQTNCCSTM